MHDPHDSEVVECLEQFGTLRCQALPCASLCDAAVKGGSVPEEVFSFIYKDVFAGYKKAQQGK